MGAASEEKGGWPGVRAGASAQADREPRATRLPGGVRARSRAPESAGVRRGLPGSGAPQAASGTRADRPPALPPPASGYVAPRGASREAGGGAVGRDFRLRSRGRRAAAPLSPWGRGGRGAGAVRGAGLAVLPGPGRGPSAGAGTEDAPGFRGDDSGAAWSPRAD